MLMLLLCAELLRSRQDLFSFTHAALSCWKRGESERINCCCGMLLSHVASCLAELAVCTPKRQDTHAHSTPSIRQNDKLNDIQNLSTAKGNRFV